MTDRVPEAAGTRATVDRRQWGEQRVLVSPNRLVDLAIPRVRTLAPEVAHRRLGGRRRLAVAQELQAACLLVAFHLVVCPPPVAQVQLPAARQPLDPARQHPAMQ